MSGIAPAEDHQRELCNYGYARGRCPHFPADAPADAVRFSLISEQQAIYILEKDHSPMEWGPVAQASACVARQADAFVRSWLAIQKAERASTAST